MGDLELFNSFISIVLLSVVVYNLITALSFKDLIRRFGHFKESRKDYYECGFRPANQRPVRFSIQFILICVFFLLYDIELVFFFPLVSAFSTMGLEQSVLLVLLFKLIFFSL